ncbi:rhamnogalacturonan acetylesterase [Bacillus solitudinis]|uniref:rhamnogalacturonan acetylesterase n=1 Tax=Bacillus solitudinis TaxID=2014074 RepID=UPI000C233219|nr:rhamnogalacturonan acetylesterase [Bacillus solitudinis]
MSKYVNVFLAGDSTMQTYKSDDPQAGWGQFIEKYFSEDIKFFNHAIGGRSSKTFVKEDRLNNLLQLLNENDYLLLQMGHNDATPSRPERYTEPFTTYKEYLKMYIDGAKQRQAIPILITPVGRLHYKDGQFVNDFQDYCMAMKEVALEESIQLIDLMAMSLDYYSTIGYDHALELFMISVKGEDITHFTKKGADHVAKLVSKGMKELDNRLSTFVK